MRSSQFCVPELQICRCHVLLLSPSTEVSAELLAKVSVELPSPDRLHYFAAGSACCSSAALLFSLP